MGSSHFLLGQFSHHIPDPTVYVSHFARFSVFLNVFPGPTMCDFHFPLLSVFSPQSRSYSVYLSYFMFFTVFCHIPVPKGCVSHFARFSAFLGIFLFLTCVFLIFLVCQFSHQNAGPNVCVSHFARFFSVSRHIPGNTVFVSFSMFVSFLTTI